MHKGVLAAGIIALLATVSAVNAAEVTGRIKVIDDTDHRIILTNGQVFSFSGMPGEPNFATFDDGFHAGEKVRIIHNGGSATSITPLS